MDHSRPQVAVESTQTATIRVNPNGCDLLVTCFLLPPPVDGLFAAPGVFEQALLALEVRGSEFRSTQSDRSKWDMNAVIYRTCQ